MFPSALSKYPKVKPSPEKATTPVIIPPAAKAQPAERPIFPVPTNTSKHFFK